MFAFFNNQEEPNLTVYDSGINAAELNEDKKQLEAQIQQLVHAAAVAIDDWEGRLTDAEKAVLPKEVQKSLAREKTKRNAADEQILYSQGLGAADAEYQSLLRQLQEIDKQLASGVSTMVLKELAAPRRTTVFVQGDFTRPADEVTCGTPAALPPLRKAAESANRLDLARWIVSSENPLTSRVIVNRVWQQYFGRGIVETENDFGLQGSSPSHPELLDWLAVTFVERGWSLKELHRLIVTSQTYRQSSIERPDLLERDRSNILLARQTRLRLDSEIIRDVCLSASDLLNNKLGGPPVFPPVPDGVMALGQSNREWKVSEGADRYRRGLYTFIYRATPPPSLNVFDAPDGYSTCTRRVRSNTPLQALALMNDSAFVEIATSLERQIQSDGLANAFIRCTSRPPTADEIQVLERLDPLSAARVMLNLDETVTRE